MRFHFFGFGGKMYDPPKKRHAKRGRKVTFHGAFGSKAEAKKKESETPHSYIRKSKGRYRVLTRN